MLERWQAAVRPQLARRPRLRVVDVGAGTGLFAAAWPAWGPQPVAGGPGQVTVVAVEPNLAMIQAAPAGIRYVRAVAEHLPLADRSVDALWLSTVLHHFTDLDQAIAECVRVLRPDGCVLVRTFLPGRTEITWLGAFPGQAKALARFPDLDVLSTRFQAHGLTVSHVDEVLEEVWTFAESADWVERMRHADSMLTALTDTEVAQGVRTMRARPTWLARNELSLVVFRPHAPASTPPILE